MALFGTHQRDTIVQSLEESSILYHMWPRGSRQTFVHTPQITIGLASLRPSNPGPIVAQRVIVPSSVSLNSSLHVCDSGPELPDAGDLVRPPLEPPLNPRPEALDASAAEALSHGDSLGAVEALTAAREDE